MMLGGKTLESSTKECSSKFRSKHSTVLVLCLLRNLLEQSLQYITLTPSYANSSYAMFSGQSQERILGYCCT